MYSPLLQSFRDWARCWKVNVFLMLGVMVAVEWLQPAVAMSSLPPAFPQLDYPTDTLRRLLKRSDVPDTMRVYYLCRLAVHLGQTDLNRATRYAREAVALARRTNNVAGEIQSLRVLGNTMREMGDYVGSMQAYQTALNLAEKRQLKQQLVPLYLSMGTVSAATGDNARSLKFLLKGHAVLTQLYKPETPEHVEDYALSYIGIGNTYYQLKEYDKAREYARQALELYRRPSTTPGSAKANLLMGRIYQADVPHTSARLDSAGFYLQAALYIEATKENEKEVAGNLISLAELYWQQHKYRDMYLMALRSLKTARKVGSVPLQKDAATLVAKAAAAMGNYQEAYRYQTQAEKLTSIMVDMEKARALEQLQVRYDVQAQGQRIESLTQRARTDAAAAQEQKRWLWMLVALCSSLFLGLVIVTGLIVRLRASRRELAQANEELGQANSQLAEANGQLAEANKQVSQSVAEKEVLLQEIHHRVKNNLQLISSMLSWQQENLPDPYLVQVFEVARTRILSMAMVHEFLYQADNLASVRLDTYLTALLDSLHSSLATDGRDIELVTALAPVLMDAKDASYFGLLVNELVTNAYKHAFSDQTSGTLRVELLNEGRGFYLSISDDGKGLPEAGFVPRPKSIGIQLVKTLVRQLKAKIQVQPQRKGTRLEITRLH